ncbi:hypothetical protein V6N11_008942 [Hibiscus sabdariffa]|uniref:RNase H type-1 domain-containing protein n=1 Tax=Hibiscus sabdariffa TaxID=183260 RepID=A0ABR2PP93_9ROSI
MLERSRRLRDLSARAMCQNFNVLRLASNQSNDTTPVRVVVWQIPPPGCYKLNTDGSRRKIDGQASCGGVVRDSNGAWCFEFSKFIGSCFIIDVELWGVYRFMMCIGLGFAMDNGGDRLLGCCTVFS